MKTLIDKLDVQMQALQTSYADLKAKAGDENSSTDDVQKALDIVRQNAAEIVSAQIPSPSASDDVDALKAELDTLRKENAALKGS